jgi:glycosyltransferase involved in cell wall biosynthesis
MNKIVVFKPSVAMKEEFERLRNSVKGDFVLYYTRLVPIKGVLEIPFIWKRFLEYSRRKFQLYVAGAFDDRKVEEAFNTLVSKLDLKENIKYLGYLKRSELMNYVANAKAVIYPSHIDAIPLVVLECLASGTPVVAYDIPAIRFNYSLTEGVCIVPEFDVSAMALGLSQLIESQAEYERISLPTWDQVPETEISSILTRKG